MLEIIQSFSQIKWTNLSNPFNQQVNLEMHLTLNQTICFERFHIRKNNTHKNEGFENSLEKKRKLLNLENGYQF